MLHDFSGTVRDKFLFSRILVCMLWRTFELHFCWVVLRSDHALRRSVIVGLVPGTEHRCLASRVCRARLECGAWPQLLAWRHSQILRQLWPIVALARQLFSSNLLVCYRHSFFREAIGDHCPHVHAELGCLSVVHFDCGLALCMLGTVTPAREILLVAQVSSHIESLCQWCIVICSCQSLLELLGRNARESSVRNYSLVIASDCHLRCVLTW